MTRYVCIVNTQPPGHDIFKVGWYTIVDKIIVTRYTLCPFKTIHYQVSL